MQEKKSDKSKSTDQDKWYLRILDKSVFGPVDLETLCSWANQARIIPGHYISSDQVSWIAVETIEDFRMNWQVALKNGDIYGPLNISLLKTMIHDDIIDANATITNITTGKTATVIRMMLDLVSEDSALRLELEEVKSLYQEAKSQRDKALNELTLEKELRENEHAENARVQEELEEQFKQAQKEQHAIEVIDVYPEAILINKPENKGICTQETLEQLEIQASRDLEAWHKSYKGIDGQKKSRFSPLQLFR